MPRLRLPHGRELRRGDFHDDVVGGKYNTEASHSSCARLASAVREAASATKALAAANQPHHPDLRFFQAAATTILFLAMLFQARSLHAIHEEGRLPLALFLFWVIVGISAMAEVMGILAAGTATRADERSVGGLLVVLLSGVCFGPYWDEIKQRKAKRGARVCWYILWGVLTVVGIKLVESRI
jgi:hypothetical protein